MSDNAIIDLTATPGTSVATWDPLSGAPLPAYLTDTLGELGTNIADRMSVPSLSYEGKTWAIHKDGNKTKLQVQNADGDMVPVPIMRLIILNYNPDRGRAYYPGLYNPATSSAPVCWSADGKFPDPSVKEKQSPACNGCPMSIKGSKVADGKELVACGSHRMIAVAPAFDLASDPLRLKIAVTSDYDKEIVEHGWFAFRQYADFLKSRGVTHTALVVTKVKFDMQAQYPKLLFALDRVLSPDEIGQMKVALANPKVAELLAEKWTAAGTAGTPIDDIDIAPQPALQETTPVGQIAPQPVAPVGRPKPTDSAHIAHAGTEYELWWDDTAWVKPWDGTAPVAPPAPVAPVAPAAPVQPAHDPIASAEADGWIAHPDAPGHHYKGQEVVTNAELVTRYPAGNAAGGAAAQSTAASPAASPSSALDVQPTASSPSDPAAGVVPNDVQLLLNKWGGAGAV